MTTFKAIKASNFSAEEEAEAIRALTNRDKAELEREQQAYRVFFALIAIGLIVGCLIGVWKAA